MKHVFIISVLCQLCFWSYGQKTIWSATQNWKIYGINKKEAYFYTVDTLVNFKSTALNDSIVRSFLCRATALPKNQKPVWMGVFIATYEADGDKKPRKLVLSSYGGFFFDAVSKTYFELPVKIRGQWHAFINENLRKVFGTEVSLREVKNTIISKSLYLRFSKS